MKYFIQNLGSCFNLVTSNSLNPFTLKYRCISWSLYFHPCIPFLYQINTRHIDLLILELHRIRRL